MEILFCDLCNESVPESAVGEGLAYYRKGRLICADCDSAMGGTRTTGVGTKTPALGTDVRGVKVPDALPAGGLQTAEVYPHASGAAGGGLPGRGGGAGGVVIGLIAIAFAAVGFSMVLERIEEVGVAVEDAEDALESETRAARSDHRQHVASLPGILAEKATQEREYAQVQRDLLSATLQVLRQDLGMASERESALTKELERLRGDLGKQATASDERESALKQTIANLEQDVRFFSDRMIELEETLRSVSSRPVPIGGTPPAGDGALPAPTAKAWQSVLADLKHSNAGIRLDAIYALGETGDADVIPHLIPMLSDADLFVRMATARMLEDLNARAGVPGLIDALEDNQSAVREAAMVALRKITSRNFGFEPMASPAERVKRVKAWRDWWKKEGDTFLTS
ncbi:MAG: HEAT repeat domain-containing protein [Planctomycetota bacterium]|nr:HEAT repeat domain-containing protein [Planctomycetota bacterium]